MTANLLHERGDPQALASLLERFSPDVVVTQELGPACAEVIEAHYPFHHLRPAREFIGRGVASRLDAEFGDVQMPVREGTWALLTLRGRLVRLVGMHLANPIEFPWWTSVRDRKRQLEALFEWTDLGDDDMPLLVAGDMNASPMWPAYRRMADRWADLPSRWAASVGQSPERTWAWRPGWPRMLRIDHVFGMGFEATGCTVEPITGSDHHAVVVDVEITG